MYMAHTAADFRRHLALPDDYTVDGILAYGTWDLQSELGQLPFLRDSLASLGIDHTLTRLDEPLIGHAWEILLADGRRFWFTPVMGTAMMGAYLHFGTLFGSRMNILLGSAGGLAPGMSAGDLLVPDAVVGNDNARMYDRENSAGIHHPDPALTSRVVAAIEGDAPVWVGTTTTCEMMLAETQQDVDDWSTAGMLGVEMEAALTFSISKHFGVPSAALLYVADNLVENETTLSDTYQEQRGVRRQRRTLQYRVGLSLLFRETATNAGGAASASR